MVKHKKLLMAVVGALALFGASAANAFGPIKAGDWDLSVAGNVNAFYNFSHCDTNAHSITGGLACTASPGGTTGVSSVTSGLLPSAIVFSAKTTQEGFDIGVVFGFYPDINIDAVPGSDGGINMRQNFLTFGDKEMGTVKMGRDLGIFGSDAIISDFTILGVGGGVGSNAPGNTTLGRIGFGYIYADWIPQITYITPSFNGFQVSLGVFQPLKMQSDLTFSAHNLPMFQAKGTYDYDVSDVKGRVWAGGLIQRSTSNGSENSVATTFTTFNSVLVGGVSVPIIPPLVFDTAGFTSPADSTNFGVTAYGGEVGVKGAVAGWEAVFYYYQTRGVGSTLLFANGIDSSGNKRNSDGGYAQLQYQMGKWKPGISYGISRLRLGSGESEATNPSLLFRNRMLTAQLQYSLTKALSLVGEYSYIKSDDQVGNKNMQGAYSLGAILFF